LIQLFLFHATGEKHMRQLIVKTAEGRGEDVLSIAREHQGRNMAVIKGREDQQVWDLAYVYVDNEDVSPLLNDLGKLEDAQITLLPSGVIPMHPPDTSVANQVAQVTNRSPIEIWLGGLMSIGSWKGFIGYTIAGSIVVWIGMYTNTIYLLVAAMLVAPFAGPAMNTALATATGDSMLLRSNLLRYFVSLALTMLITAGVSLLLRQEVATITMVDVSQISSVALLLPLISGAAGALNLINSENNSLVSGAAVGVLVTASLAPPAGLVGMSAAIGRWDMAVNGLFLLALQLVGINIAGALVFRFYGGLKPVGARFQRGKSRYAYLSFIGSLILLGGLLFVQFRSAPAFQRSTQSQAMVQVVRDVVNGSDLAQMVEAELNFTRPSQAGENTLLGLVYVERNQEVDLTDEEIRRQLTTSIQQGILDAGFNVSPLISVTVLESP
jgi:uncharacterized membrane protein